MESDTVQLRINFVAESKDGGYELVLVEGPWEGDDAVNLQRLETRLANCVTAVIEGHLTDRFPGLVCRPVTVRIDSYSTPRQEVDRIINGIRNLIAESNDIQGALKSGRFATEINLIHHWMDFDEEFERRMSGHPKASLSILARLKAWLFH